MVADPVERRRREDRVDPRAAEVPLDVEVREVGDDERHPVVAASRSRAASIIEAEPSMPITRPSRQPLEQRLRDPAGAAAGVDDGLVAAERQPLHNGAAHRLHRRREAVVVAPVPVACDRHGLYVIAYRRTLSRSPCRTTMGGPEAARTSWTGWNLRDQRAQVAAVAVFCVVPSV